MREIKFRGWREDDHCWVYGDLLQLSGNWMIGRDSLSEALYYSGIKRKSPYLIVESDSIGQFTGLHDKNGKEVFEGDIVAEKGRDVRNKLIETRYLIRWGEYDNGLDYEDNISGYGVYLEEIVFLRDGVVEQIYDDKIYDYSWLAHCEIVGNIYENPKLLKEAMVG